MEHLEGAGGAGKREQAERKKLLGEINSLRSGAKDREDRFEEIAGSRARQSNDLEAERAKLRQEIESLRRGANERERDFDGIARRRAVHDV